MNAVILSDALDTNGQNARYVEASQRHGDDERVIKAMVLGNADPAGVMARFQEASVRNDVGLTIRSAHRTAYEYMDYPVDIFWPRVQEDRRKGKEIEAEIARLVNDADILHLNNSWVAADYWRTHPLTHARMARNPPSLLHHHGSMFRNDPFKIMDRAKTRRWAQAVSTIDLQKPAPDLLHWLPSAFNVAELQALAATYERQPGKTITIAHCPTNRGLKHTDLFLAACAELKAEGVKLDVVLIENKSWRESLEAKAQADIVYDQLSFGYGCTSIEAWALGKPVISGADDWTLDRMARTWPSIPFEEATEATLKDVIKRMVQSEALREDAAQRGLQHVLRYHDELPALERLAELYHEAINIKIKPRIPGKAVTFHSTTRRQVFVEDHVVRFVKGVAVVTDEDVVTGLRKYVKQRPLFGIKEVE